MTEFKLDLGCGQRCKPGYVGVDIFPPGGLVGGDVLMADLSQTPWDFSSLVPDKLRNYFKEWVRVEYPSLILKEDSVDGAYCSHFIEHLTGPQRIDFMNELYRVLKPGAVAFFITPTWESHRVVIDPTHKWPPLHPKSFLYFNKGWREKNYHHGLNAIKSNFRPRHKLVPVGTGADADMDLHVELTKLKEGE